MKEKLFGRDYYLDILEKRIINLKDGYRQNITVIGDELVGKTSIIYGLLDKFQDNRIIGIYLEARPESAASFARRFIGVLLYNFLLNSCIPLREDINFLLAKSQNFIPKTTEKIKLILNSIAKRKKSDLFTELLSLCEIVNQETGKFCVVVLDEFHNLESLGFKNLYRDWSRLLIQQKNTLYIITSSLKYRTREILAKNLSLLFGNFEVIQIEPFDTKTSEEYLRLKMDQEALSPGLRDFIVHFTGGYPWYLEIITEALKSSPQENLADILENLLFESSGVLNQRFSNYIKRLVDLPDNNDCLSILYLISNGNNKIKDIAHILHKQKKEVLQKINHLQQIDAVNRSADFLKINDRVFSFWLRFVYQEKLQSLTFDAKNQKTRFRDKIEGMIQEYITNAQKPLTERMGELLRLFENDMVQIERKKIRLNHFREIKPLEFNIGTLKEGLIGRSSESLWIMAFKEETLTEYDVTEFAKECKKYRHKLQRKIIVTFRDIDTNTRLKALEEKIWAWDLNNLNQILDLFYKPRVIA